MHSLGNYVFAIGLFALDLGAWQIMLAFLLGAVLLIMRSQPRDFTSRDRESIAVRLTH